MFDAIKSLSPKQRFVGFVIVVLISAVTSLGTAYMNGSDCTEISEKYTKSIENYNKLIEITDKIQQKYLDAKGDIITIQDRLNKISKIMSEQSNTCTTKSSTKNSYDEDVFSGGNGDNGVKNDTGETKSTSPWSTPKKIIIKEKTIVTKTVAPEGAKSMIDSLLQITKKYEKKK